MATVDKKHQVIIDALAFGEGQEHHTLQPVLETVEARFRKLGIAESSYLMAATKILGTRRWGRLGIGFFYSLVMALSG